jgi:hypothetical protein
VAAARPCPHQPGATQEKALTGDKAIKGSRTAEPNKFAVSMTDFSVTIAEICKHLTKKGRKNDPVYNLGAHNFPKNTPIL